MLKNLGWVTSQDDMGKKGNVIFEYTRNLDPKASHRKLILDSEEISGDLCAMLSWGQWGSPWSIFRLSWKNA